MLTVKVQICQTLSNTNDSLKIEDGVSSHTMYTCLGRTRADKLSPVYQEIKWTCKRIYTYIYMKQAPR